MRVCDHLQEEIEQNDLRWVLRNAKDKKQKVDNQNWSFGRESIFLGMSHEDTGSDES